MASLRSTVVSSCLALAALAAATGALPGSAAATPRASLHEVQVRVDRLNREAGDAAERYNDAKVRLEGVNRRLTVVRHRLDYRRAEVDAMRSAVAALAAATYKSEGVDATLRVLLSDDPETFLQSALALQQLDRRHAVTLARIVAARQGLAAARNDVTRQQARAADIARTLAVEKRAVLGRLAEAKRLLGSLKAEQRARIAAARAAAADRSRAVASRSHDRLAAPAPSGPAAPGRPVSVSGRAAAAVQTAYAQLGDPYVFGAAGPNAFDCSGLTMYAWAAAGVALPHSSAAQYSSAPRVSVAALQPGDLVFYYSPISHVGIYVGGGRVIHAPHPGRSVEITGLHTMPLVGAVRP